ncbi:alpha/beta hydrolase [Paracoccus ravus]|uniref:alpha/beta hydrolase n=1 Tax=Paracoccus ravus TaxID=2447760 RepID=UPI00106EC013|nr:alpha/beta hydrolase [Paracoccus ravus]
MLRRIDDWDPVYDNSSNIPNGDTWPAQWVEPARAFRAACESAGRARLGLSYGVGPRNRYDLFLPPGEPRGLAVYVHGGFWMHLDRSYWSHFAAGPLAHGFAVAMPEYTLCPENRISGITHEIGTAIAAAAVQIAGPILLAGHSAGGHLVSRMLCRDAPLDPAVQSRIAKVVSISGLHDLRPLCGTWRREALSLDADEAERESPVLLRPIEGARLSCWAGSMETSEFRRQNALLANIWLGLGAATECVVEPDRHHFDIIDGLLDPEHPLTRALVDLPRG